MYDGIQWTHRIRLPDGTVTPGVWDPYFERYGLDQIDFKNKRVLDIGCLDGQYSFYAERQGASEVVSVDVQEYVHGYLYAHKKFNSKAKYYFPLSVYELNPDVLGEFDIILFLGVFYHLVHPALALERINAVLKKDGLLVLESEMSHDMTQFCFKTRYPPPACDAPPSVSGRIRRWMNILQTSIRLPFLARKSSPAELRRYLVQSWPAAFSSEEVMRGDHTVFWVMNREAIERHLDCMGFKIEKTLPFLNRISCICRKETHLQAYYSAVDTLRKTRAVVTNIPSTSS